MQLTCRPDEANEALLVAPEPLRDGNALQAATLDTRSRAAYVLECERDLRELDRSLRQLEGYEQRGLLDDSGSIACAPVPRRHRLSADNQSSS